MKGATMPETIDQKLARLDEEEKALKERRRKLEQERVAEHGKLMARLSAKAGLDRAPSGELEKLFQAIKKLGLPTAIERLDAVA